jgi:Integral membrane protein EMC3/TMCO1-like
MCVWLSGYEFYRVAALAVCSSFLTHPSRVFRTSMLYSAVEKEEVKLVTADKRKVHERSLSRLEEECKDETSKMNAMKMRSNVLSSIAFFLLYRWIARTFTGLAVVRLPFEPFELVQKITHSGVAGADVRDCGYGFIYTLATMAIKPNVPRLLGFDPPRSAFDATKAAMRAAAKAEADSQ